MARYTSSRWNRLALGTAIFVAGAVLFVARPGIALAHHVTVTETGNCAAWNTKAEYFGGDSDRKIVIDVTINGEHIAETRLYDTAHLGHAAYALLFERSGSGSVHTSGTITMYEKVNGAYSNLVNTATLNMNFNCPATPTATATSTSAATSTATTVPPTSTATSTATPVIDENTATPRPANTPDSSPTATSAVELSTATPIVSATSTPAASSETATPATTHTAITTGNIITPAPQGTPTLVSIVHSSTFPGGSLEPARPVDRALPATGQGARTRGAILAGLLGTALAAAGLAICSTGLRKRENS